ncbi:MAG: CBS domain-containing protein [Desulfurococcales archaeon]|nr:CBS domain-containing protein [Desulfurococcales archaeon]
MAPRVSSYMTTPVVVVKPDDTLAHARNLMLKKDIGRLVVVDEAGRPIGVITISDIIRALVSKYMSRPIDTIMVEEAMTRDPITIESTRSLKTVAGLMLKYKIGGLPVVDSARKLIGIITRSDIVAAFSDKYRGKYKVGDIMRRTFAKAEKGHSLYYISRLIESDPAGKVIVVDENDKPIGIIAKRDIAFTHIDATLAASRGKDRFIKIKTKGLYADKIISARVYLVPIAEDIMSTDPIQVDPDFDAADAARIMNEEGIGILPVTDSEGKVIGVLSKIEILAVMAKEG